MIFSALKKILAIGAITIAVVCIPLVTLHAADTSSYQLLAPLSGELGQPVSTNNFTGYAQAVIKFTVGFSSVLAILVITYGGFLYMTGEAMHTKEEGLDHVKSAFLGLALLLGSWLILNTINPDLLNLDLNRNLKNTSPAVTPSAPKPVLPVTTTPKTPAPKSGKIYYKPIKAGEACPENTVDDTDNTAYALDTSTTPNPMTSGGVLYCVYSQVSKIQK